jgi:hypothetical protein
MSSSAKSGSTEFQLVNPVVSGVKSTSFAETAAAAAKNIWGEISGFFSSHVPSMTVTVENKETGELTHHEIKESQRGGGAENGSIRFTVSKPLKNVKMSGDQQDKFKAASSKMRRQFGGGDDDKDKDKKKSRKHRKDDSSSSSSSSSDDDTYKRRRRTKVKYDDVWLPPTQWWYAAMYGADYLYVPTFISPLTPSIQISTDWVPVLLY